VAAPPVKSGLARRLALVAAFVACATVVVAYQVTRPTEERLIGQPFVPLPQFFLDFSPSFRTTIADAYWLQTIQYYGEHVRTDQEYDRLKPMLDLVTELSPRFERAYLFGAYALLDAGLGNDAYRLLERGFERNPDAWRIATNAGILMYGYGPEDVKREVAAGWFDKAAAMPGAPLYVSRIAARLLAEGGETEKALALYAEIYATGDKYSRGKALTGLDGILPKEAAARRAELEKVRDLMAPETFDKLVRALGAS
jgi:tetratricopeptide (TPR) repeat protein